MSAIGRKSGTSRHGRQFHLAKQPGAVQATYFHFARPIIDRVLPARTADRRGYRPPPEGNGFCLGLGGQKPALSAFQIPVEPLPVVAPADECMAVHGEGERCGRAMPDVSQALDAGVNVVDAHAGFAVKSAAGDHATIRGEGESTQTKDFAQFKPSQDPTFLGIQDDHDACSDVIHGTAVPIGREPQRAGLSNLFFFSNGKVLDFLPCFYVPKAKNAVFTNAGQPPAARLEDESDDGSVGRSEGPHQGSCRDIP